jgi:hypothetical protein
MELRKQKAPRSGPNDAVGSSPVSATTNGQEVSTPSGDQAAFIPDNEIVTVRFTFSRGRSRDADTKTSEMEQSAHLESLEVDRDMMSLSGAFSPGIELESALNEAAVDESVQPERAQSFIVTTDAVDYTPTEEDHHKHTGFDLSRDKTQAEITASVDASAESPSENDLPDPKTVEVEASHDQEKQSIQPTAELAEQVAVISDSSESLPAPVDSRQLESTDHAQETTNAADQPVEAEDPPAIPEPDQTDAGDPEEESYEEDNFDDEPLPSSRAVPDQVEANDKHETSGYGSEFDEDPGTANYNITHEASRSSNQVDGEDPEEEASYSHDDFE